ncbi:MAG TPA: ABC transporter ATP-binding protein [Cyanobacteria bacterium UBA8530]|nr:ABC transporter ATP-binding protein [Cyanobacteria bacterium UBA8530]
MSIEIRDLEVFRKKKKVLSIEKLEIPAGQILSILGPNGAGKSTLLLAIAQLIEPKKGEILFEKQPVPWGNLDLRRKISMVFQDPLLLDDTVFGNVATGLKVRGIPRKEWKNRILEQLGLLGIVHLAKRSSRSLSGGEAQRVSLCRALVFSPEVLLLDEPFAALDPASRPVLIAELKKLLRQKGITALFVTHDRNEALMLGDRIAVLEAGRLIQIGAPQEVFSTPATASVAALVGVENVLPGKVVHQEQGVATIEVQGIEVRAVSEAREGEKIWFCLRPEDVVLHIGPLGPSSLRNHLEGTVRSVLPLEAQVRVTIDCAFPVAALITKQAFFDLELREGKVVGLSFKASAVHLIPRS